MKKSRHILITREIGEHSPLMEWIDKGHMLTAQSLISIHPIHIDTYPHSEVYFYYSKNAVKCLWDQRSLDLSTLRQKNHACMGEGTAEVLRSYDISPDFVGSGKPEDVRSRLLHQYQSRSVCFVRAEKSTKSIQSNWPFSYDECIVYRVAYARVELSDPVDVLVATSPKNIESYFDQYDDPEGIVCIGDTTMRAAECRYQGPIVVAQQTSELGLSQALQYFIATEN